MIFGGIYSSTRQAIKGPAVVEGKTLYIYPEQYEGQERDPLIFCTGPVPAQQVEPAHPVADASETGAKKFALPVGRLHLAARAEREGPRGRRRRTAARSSRRSTSPSTTWTTRETVEKIMASGAEVVFNTIVPPGLTPFLEQLHDAGFTERGGQLVCTYFDENFLNLVPAEQVEGLYSCLDYYQDAGDPVQQAAARALRRAASRAARMFTARQRVLGHVPRPEALGGGGERGGLARPGRRDRGPRPREDRRRAGRPGRDGARPAPRADEHVHRPGPATAQFEVVENLGVIDPKEPMPV